MYTVHAHSVYRYAARLSCTIPNPIPDMHTCLPYNRKKYAEKQDQHLVDAVDGVILRYVSDRLHGSE